MNKVILMGNLTRDPEVRQMQTSNIAHCTFTIAVQRRFKSQDGQTKTDFINCVAWRTTAEFIGKYFSKGNKILVTGSLQVRDYENNEGKKVYVTEVIVDDAEFCNSKSDSDSNKGSFGSPVDTAPIGSNNHDNSAFFQMDTDINAPF